MRCWLPIILVLHHSKVHCPPPPFASIPLPDSTSPSPLTLVCHLTLPRPMQDWLWGTPITNSTGNRVLVTTGCSRGYCRCQPWYTGDKAECRFTVSQEPAQRDRQCTCNRQGKVLMSYYKANLSALCHCA